MSAERIDWRGAIVAIASRLAREDYPSGSLAGLRRLDPSKPDGAAFWWMVAEYAPSAFENPRDAGVLAAVVHAMAIAHPFHRPLSGRRSLGEALAEAGVSEARLLRLLRLRADKLPDELRRLARLMASKGDDGRFDWSCAPGLLLWQGDAGERVRRDIARDYYRQQFHLQAPKESAA
jgi:CRISPR type I-E-associated protein CasB/Cse2